MKRCTQLLLIMWAALDGATAQGITGAWYGRGDAVVSGNASNYLAEFVLKDKGGGQVEGVFAYFFKDSYQSFFVRGTYNRSTRQLLIRDLPVLFYASPARTGIECPMHFQATLMVSRAGSSLTGSFFTEDKYKYTCPEIRVFLRRDTSAVPDLNDPRALTTRRFWSPGAEDLIVTAFPDSTTPHTAGVSMETPEAEPAPPEPLPPLPETVALEEAFGKRNNIYQKDIEVSQDTVLVSFYDNGDIDDDTISVFINKKPVLVRRGLSSRALNIYIGLDTATEITEISMFADNLGKYPPNTALMVISDGNRRYELYLSASLNQNASVRLRRRKR